MVGSSNGTEENCYYLIGCAKDGNDFVQNGIGSITQGSATADVLSATTGMETEHFTSGMVAYYLNGGKTDGTQAFYQTVGVGTPALSGETVYYRSECDGVTMVYSNSAKPTTHDTSLTAAEYYNADGTCKACGTQAAVSLTTADETPVVTYYATLPAAITAAQSANGSTVKLLSDVQLSKKLTISSGKFTIDLNDKTISDAPDGDYETDPYLIRIEGTNTEITVDDSSTDKNGTITFGYTDYDGGAARPCI